MAAAAARGTRVNIKIVSDTRRLEKALETVRTTMGVEVDVEWLPFFLNANLPKEGVDKLEHYKKKFGAHRVAQMLPQMIATGKRDGINFSYGGKIGNTMDSHRLASLAKKQGKQNEVMEELFKKYFEQEQCLSDRDVLLDAAKKAGVEGAAEMLDGDAETDTVLSEVRMVHGDYGVSGVPFFIFDDKFAFSGAQDADTIVNVIKQVVAKRAEKK